jgi:hypothetical protein
MPYCHYNNRQYLPGMMYNLDSPSQDNPVYDHMNVIHLPPYWPFHYMSSQSFQTLPLIGDATLEYDIANTNTETSRSNAAAPSSNDEIEDTANDLSKKYNPETNDNH